MSQAFKWAGKAIQEGPKLSKGKFVTDLGFAIEQFPNYPWHKILKRFYRVVREVPGAQYESIFCRGQMMGKKWLHDELRKLDLNLGLVFLLAGWSGFIAYALLSDASLKIKKVRSFDIDPSATQMAEILLKEFKAQNWKFKATTQDILELDYYLATYETVRHDGTLAQMEESPNTIINLSCEHFKNLSSWWAKIPPGTLAVLQSTNYDGEPGHVCCPPDLESFVKSAPMNKVYYAQEREFFHYKRFMLIGEV